MSVKKESILFGILFSIMLIASVNASIYLSQPDSSYNLGDSIEVNITIEPLVDGPFKLKLVCDSKSIDVFSGPAIENIVLPLNALWIEDLKGSCYFVASYGGEQQKTNNFIISDKLDVKLDSDSFYIKPGETIEIKGYVTRINGDAEEGEVEIVIPFSGAINTGTSSEVSNGTSNETITNETVSNETIANETITPAVNLEKFYSKVSNGEFSVSLRLPDNAAAGDYTLLVNAYDQSLIGTRINQGSSSGILKVPQVLTGIDIALNNQNFEPGQNVSIKPNVFDQTNKTMTNSVFVSIFDSSNEKLFEKMILSGDTGVYEIPTNLPSDYYTIEAFVEEVGIEKSFFVSEKPRVEFEITNDTLLVKNIGNARYTKEIQVDIGGKPFTKNVDLGVGEAKEFYLSGQDQSYNVRASDGESEMTQDGVLLTGNAINVSDVRYNLGNFFSNPLLWLVILLIVAIFISIFSTRVIKRRSVARPGDYYGKPKNLKLEGMMKKETKEVKQVQPTVIKKRVSIVPIVPPTEAEQGIVSNGHRNTATIVAVKVKNKITPFAKEFVQKSVNSVYSRKGAVMEQGEYIIAIFSPLCTRTMKNEIDAARVAEDISNYLMDYNKKFKEPIEFGIGVNSGEIINEIRDRKLLFTALGNSLLMSKRLAELASNEVLLSDDVYHKGMSEIKADRKVFGDVVGFKIKKVVDFEQNKKFIDDFLKRAEKDSGVKYVRKDGGLSNNRVGSGNPSANSLLRDAKKDDNKYLEFR